MEQRISVLMAIDEHYAGPLFVTVTSLVENLRAGVGLELHLMDGDLTPATRRKLEGAWDDRVRLHWVLLDHDKLEVLRHCGCRPSLVANLRLLVGSSLQRSVSKVIYLDADLLIRRDISEIWDQDMHGKIVLAVQDSYIQRLPALCLPPREQAKLERPYFNSGVMVIDLEAWRAAEIEQGCLETAKRLRHRTRWLDQDVLNTCLAGRWGLLPPVWNKQFSLELFPDWRCSPYEEREFYQARSQPAVIHFCTRTKPWHTFCDHPPQEVVAYRATLRGTAFADVLEVQPSRFGRAVNFFAAPHRRLLDTLAAAVQAKRRKHALKAMLPDMLRLAILHPWTLLTVPLSVVRARLRRREASV